ncbi:Acyl-CoA dehydrogenase [Paraburkholderia steynii]|uniref:Acyl-CoA dehydrogenase n=1 Tax=Paraburkholderia steynii TaxID=1245441 RepID=A0A7Z7BAY0_9BURK|nr:acyl-CoA dehydrogenase family protein [Paraburkholderia steynii]SDI49931.1 Acyl-CoA dehydrogenase [Paraburkholderia steynii]
MSQQHNEIFRRATDDGDELALRMDLVSRARELTPLLRKNAERTDADRRVVEENVQALKDAGLFRMMVPKRYGGHEAGFRTNLEVTSAVAEGCGSTSWILNLISINAWGISLMSRQAQDDVFGANPDSRAAGVLSPAGTGRRTDGGVRVTGKWYFASGSLHANWGMVGFTEVGVNDEPLGQYLALIPVEEMTIEDTWFTVGMRGSGSNCFVAQDVYVPDHRILSVASALEGDYPTPFKNEPVYQTSFIPAATIVLAGPQLGLARAALRHVIETAGKRSIAYTSYAKQTDSTAFQLQIADAAMKIDAAHLMAWRCTDAIDAAAKRGSQLDLLTRARCRADTGYAVQQVTEALQILVSAHGAGTFAQTNPLQRIWRDSNTGARHAIVMPVVNTEIYGKALLGVETNITPLI